MIFCLFLAFFGIQQVTIVSKTGTVAWFTANNSVSLTGMTVKTKVGNNILISASNSESAFAPGLNQPVNGLLEPVSSIDGENFFYAEGSNVAGSGAHISNTFVAYDPDDTDGFNEAYSTTGAVGYVDYAFYLKAQNTDSSAKNLRMSACNMSYVGVTTNVTNAWRVAVFAVATTKNTTVTNEVDSANLKSILRTSASKNFSQLDETPTTKAVDSVNSLAAVTYGNAATIGSINANTTAYYKLTVRLWLEGEDTTCNNETFASLTEDFRLNLSFDISASAGVTTITAAAEAVAEATNLMANVDLDSDDKIANGEVASTFQWVNAATGANIDSATNSSYTGTDGMSVYCLVTTVKGNVYRTNTVSLANA